MWLEPHEKPLRCGCSRRAVHASAESFSDAAVSSLSKAGLEHQKPNKNRGDGQSRCSAEGIHHQPLQHLRGYFKGSRFSLQARAAAVSKAKHGPSSAGPCAVAGRQWSRLLVTKAQAEFRGSFGFDASSPARLGCRTHMQKGKSCTRLDIAVDLH